MISIVIDGPQSTPEAALLVGGQHRVSPRPGVVEARQNWTPPRKSNASKRQITPIGTTTTSTSARIWKWEQGKLNVRIGINPISWTNDDLPQLGGNIPLETCLSEGTEIGYEEV